MSESAKPRFAIDLDEIERQLAQAQAPRTLSRPPSGGTIRWRNWPGSWGRTILSQSLLANDGAARPRQQGRLRIDDLFAVRDTMTPSPREVPVRAPQARRCRAALRP